MSFIDEGIPQRVEVLQGAIDSFTFFPKVDGVNVVPTSATVGVYDPAGGAKVPEAATAVGANGRLTVSQAWPAGPYYLSEDYFAVFTYVVAGVTYSDRVYFDVVKTKLLCPISHTMLVGVYPDLEQHLTAIGEADSTKSVKRAWAEILDRIRSGGNRPSLILDVKRLISPALHLALHYVCLALEREVGDLWNERNKEHYKRYNALYTELGQLRYDLNEDGLADRQETSRIARVRFRV